MRQSFNWCACAPRTAAQRAAVRALPLGRSPTLTAARRDCGLACVLMTLGGLGALRCDLRVMRRLCPTTSIWTVDLAHLLRRFGVDVTFCTITLGANPDFASEARARSRALGACRALSCTDTPAVLLRGHHGGGRTQSRTAVQRRRVAGYSHPGACAVGSHTNAAHSHAAAVQRRSVSLDELRRLVLSGNYLVIALVDKRKARWLLACG